jgi:hypothetical protein
MYLCYDIKGIQRFIFSVPKLKCVIGASGLIAEFDEDTVVQIGREYSAERVFSGGGRGAFRCTSQEQAEDFEGKLIDAAHRIGLDIRIGIAELLSDAAHHADRLYPYCPKTLEGPPCAMSGLWPAEKEGKAHRLVFMRAAMAGKDRLGRTILQELRSLELIPDELKGYELRFFKNVNPEPDTDEDPGLDEREARAAQAALGNRNRWAVVAMDGNDMGRQFLAFEAMRAREDWPEEKTREWLKIMSSQLNSCTRIAFLTALGRAIAAWFTGTPPEDLDGCFVEDANGDRTNTLILPFRPLILGGDDLTMLCHSTYAMQFVRDLSETFQEQSRIAARESALQPLWPATNGELTISAGILYTKVTYPLHSAIPYADSLLASAKGKYRAHPKSNVATRPAVDWDTITDTLVDTPAARRNRELRFFDAELGREIQLTRRPYVLDGGNGHPELTSLLALKEKLAHIPPSVRARILPSLQRPWSERIAFVASLAKRHKVFMDELWEGDAKPAPGWIPDDEAKVQATGWPDALLLLEEEHRLARPTVDD